MKKILLLSLLFTQPALAELINGDIINGCNTQTLHDINNITNMFPVFSAHKHTCNSNEFLPAYTDGCRACPTGYECNGGTYVFNETVAQGISEKRLLNESITYGCSNNLLHPNDNITNMIPIWTANQHTCAPGYYLPANVDSCTICPADNYCVGGTFTFNETENQGIEQCANPTPFAPIGSTVCYPHVLHIGNDVVYLKSTKLTMPSLNVGMDDGIFYANMTTTSTPMNNATEHYLKIEYDGVIYYVCDDTTYGK